MDVSWKTVARGIVAPEGPAVDRSGNVFLVSRWTGRVVKVDADGRVTDVVHTGGKPQSVALLESGDLLLAEHGYPFPGRALLRSWRRMENKAPLPTYTQRKVDPGRKFPRAKIPETAPAADRIPGSR